MNTQKIDLTGQRFGSWTVLKELPPKYEKGRGTMWLCQCDCGTIKAVHGQPLREGRTKSCGCQKGKKITEWHKKNTKPNQREKGIVIIVANEEALTLDEWAERLNINRSEILQRLLEGATPTEAVKN